MDAKTPIKSERINNVRNLAVSRRGGVKTRGGRLPPINMRELAMGNKKVIAPNIPQRRRIKTEAETSDQATNFFKVEKTSFSENARGRGRGRQQKVFLQTEGTFLAQGPAARLKRDPAYDESYSVPRSFRKSAKASSDKNIDADAIKELMESYVAGEEYENYSEGKPPFRLPIQKDKMANKIKLESDKFDDKIQIKKEIIEDFETGVKKEIKTEKDDELTSAKSNIKEEFDGEKLSDISEIFQKIKDDGTLILFQLPLLPNSFKIEVPDKDNVTKEKDKKSSKESEVNAKSKFIDNFEEGLVGKLKIMKSGRLKLTLGPVEFELLDGTPSQTYQEVVSIQIRDKEVNELTTEGKNAIDSPGSPALPDLLPEDYILDEYEERSMIEPASYEDPRLKELINVLIEWINDELAGQRIIVKDIEEDLYDGQVLQKLLEKLMDVKLDVVEVTQSEEGQKLKLKRVLEAANNVLGVNTWNQAKWNVESIHSKNVVAILHLLVSLARHFRAPIRLPENIVVNVVVVQKRDGMLHTRKVAEEITSTYDDLGMRYERDAFDTLFDHAPDKLQVVKKSLMTFVNTHLNKINLEVTDLDTQFHDGLYLTFLMGLLEGYFVPLYSFNLTPTTFDQKVHNVSFAFELMMDAGLPKPKARPEDIVNIDLKSTLRVLYNLFSKYKHLS